MERVNFSCSAAYEWSQNNGVLAIASTAAKITALAGAALAVGCAVVVITTGSLPYLTLSMIAKGSVELVMATTNLSCCVRLFQKILHPQTASWKDVAGLVATLFATTWIGFYTGLGSSHKLFEYTYNGLCSEVGFLVNLAASTRIYESLKQVFSRTASIQTLSAEVSTAALGTMGTNALLNKILKCRLKLHDLSSISAVVIGSVLMAGLIAKIAQLVRKDNDMSNK